MLVNFVIRLILIGLIAVFSEGIRAEDNIWDSIFNVFGGSKENSQTPLDGYFRLLKSESVNEYWLYTRNNPVKGQRIFINDEKSLLNSHMDKTKTTVFLVHGWLGYYTDDLNQNLTAASLKHSDVNVICVDWNTYSQMAYFGAANAVPQVGNDLGDFISWLVHMGFCYDNIHLVGHSLGAHIVGYAGRRTAGKIRRITGLDPAGPTWNNDKRLSPRDGRYVEGIHTCSMLLGTTSPCGHADFYPNGGSLMPGCGMNMTCSHVIAFYYFSATILYPEKFVGHRCNSVFNALKSDCHGKTALMGNIDMSKKTYGIYYANVPGEDYPYFK